MIQKPIYFLLLSSSSLSSLFLKWAFLSLRAKHSKNNLEGISFLEQFLASSLQLSWKWIPSPYSQIFWTSWRDVMENARSTGTNSCSNYSRSGEFWNRLPKSFILQSFILPKSFKKVYKHWAVIMQNCCQSLFQLGLPVHVFVHYSWF